MKFTVDKINITPELLAARRRSYQPGGSGPGPCTKVVVQLIEAIAAEKGWDLDNVEYKTSNYQYLDGGSHHKKSKRKCMLVTHSFKGLTLLSTECGVLEEV